MWVYEPVIIRVPLHNRHRQVKLFISSAPAAKDLETYIDRIVKCGVQHVVKVCDVDYDSANFSRHNVAFYDMNFADGSHPSSDIIQRWLQLCLNNTDQHKGIAIHCAAGLGRAPLMCGLLLIETGMSAIDAIELLRSHIRGCLNTKQINFLISYCPSSRRKSHSCMIM